MNHEEQYEPEIDLKDLLFHILYRWRSVMGVAVACCVLLSAYKAVRIAGLTPEERIPQKVKEYELALARYELDKASYEQDISNDLERLAQQRDYVEKSALMQVDPYQKPVASVDLFVKLDSAEWEELPSNLGMDPTDSVIKMYTSSLASTVNWEPVKELTGMEEFYLREVLNVHTDYNSNTFTLNIVYPNGDMSQKILDIVLKQILDRQSDLADRVGRHSLTIGNQSLTYSIDLALAESQKANLASITNYERSIVDNRTLLDELKDNEPQKPFIVGFAKYPVVGFGLGALLMIVVYVASYLFDGRLHGKRNLQDRYGYRLLGILPKSPKKKLLPWVDRFLDKHANIFHSYGLEETYERIAISVDTLDKRPKKILVTGTVGLKEMQTLTEAVSRQLKDITLSASPNLNMDLRTLKMLAECDGILLLEKEGCSSIAEVRQEHENIVASGKPVVGYVLL